MYTTSEKAFPDWKEELSFSFLPLRKELFSTLLLLNYNHMTPIQAQGKKVGVQCLS